MNLLQGLVTVVLLYSSNVSGDLEVTLARCCALGANWARKEGECATFQAPVEGESSDYQPACLLAGSVCCLRFHREKQCEVGKKNAKEGDNCSVGDGTGGDYAMDCCVGCKLGRIGGRLGAKCVMDEFDFGFPWNAAYHECCSDTSANYSSNSIDVKNEEPLSEAGTPLIDLEIPDAENLCLRFPGQLCSHLCIPTKGSYICKCRIGFVISPDKKTCTQKAPEDRCTTHNPCHHSCQDTGVSIECSCREGFELELDQKTCKDINECSSGTHKCAKGRQTCYNQVGSYICVNPDGSTYTPKLTKVDQTRRRNDDTEGSKRGNPSRQDIRRTFGAQGFPEAGGNKFIGQGICPPGFTFNIESRACDDVDECTVGPELCGIGVACENTVGSYTCLQVVRDNCPEGFTYDLLLQTCIDVDECTLRSSNCDTGEFCLNTQGSYECQKSSNSLDCPAGYKYDKLRKTCSDVDECEEELHGCHPENETCRNVIGAYECDLECGAGFKYRAIPRSCVDIDECLEDKYACEGSSEICINLIGSFKCKSRAGNEVISPITYNTNAPSKLRRLLKKINLENSLVKECPSGYSYDLLSSQCLDVDECRAAIHNCSARIQSCINTLGGFICINKNLCLPGYKRSEDTGNCEDIDECEEGMGKCMPGQICVNTIGTFECQVECQDGFTYNPRDPAICVDINECLELPCRRDATCINTEGSYTCKETEVACEEGYKRVNGSCVDIDECERVDNCPGSDQGCRNVPGTFHCADISCQRGFRRESITEDCQDIDECENNPCSSDEVCINFPGEFLCQPRTPCSPGFRRSAESDNCVDIDECKETAPCGFNMRCVNTRGSYSCRSLDCPAGYTRNSVSDTCEDVNECETGEHTCKARDERCVNSLGTYRCRPLLPCPVGFIRDRVTFRCIDLDECTEGTAQCIGGEQCVNQYGRYKCIASEGSCEGGYIYNPISKRCIDIDECQANTHNCSSAFEICINSIGSFACQKKNRPCDFGFRYDTNLQTCADIDECELGIHLCAAGREECENLEGAYKCTKISLQTTTAYSRPTITTTTVAPSLSCDVGFMYNNLTNECRDLNECQLGVHSCSPSQRCDNTVGSYSCTRVAGCGTGYTLNQNSGKCEDDNECMLKKNDCDQLGPKWICVNTKGSFRCEKKQCSDDLILNSWGICVNVTCTAGFKPRNKICVDINECTEDPGMCKSNEKCINTVGSYRCLPKINCGRGYNMNEFGTQCIDLDECKENTHKCEGGQICLNRPGGYICQCPNGFRPDRNRICQDINECQEYYQSICGFNSDCLNTHGSYECTCKTGFEKTADSSCSDINECTTSENSCQHKCTNIWGSHFCSCNPGYRLRYDNRTCSDIDECEEMKGKGKLCIGLCVNTPGTFRCSCPQGYRLDSDKRTCKDINECDGTDACRTPDEICVNTRGSFQCKEIRCPENYVRDPTQRNRCKKHIICQDGDAQCRQQPLMYSYNFLPLASNMTLRSTGEIDLFTMRGPVWSSTLVQFELEVDSVTPELGVPPATKADFKLNRTTFNQVVLVLVRPLLGPQEILLSLDMRLHHNGVYEGSAISKLTIFVSQYDF